MSRFLRLQQIFVRDGSHASLRVDTHVHRAVQWYCCFGGCLTVIIEGIRYELVAGQCILVPPGYGRALEREPDSAYVFSLFEAVEFDPEACYGRIWPIGVDSRPVLSRLLAELAVLGDPWSWVLAESLLTQMLVDLRREAAGGQLSRRAPGEVRLVKQVDAVLQMNVSRQVTRRMVAEAVFLSEVHLARLYKQATGKTIHQRLDELRLVHVQGLLVDSTLAIGQVAKAVGFRSGSHFSKWFRRQTGTSPAAYRHDAYDRNPLKSDAAGPTQA